MTTIGDLLAIFCTMDVTKRRELVEKAKRATQVCRVCFEGRHEECSGVVDVRDETPEGEVREWEELCTCNAGSCAPEPDQRREQHDEDEGEQRRKYVEEDEDDDIGY